jgi:hypothetical protein
MCEHHIKIKQSHYRPGQALKIPEFWGSQITRQSAHESGKFVSPKHHPPLPPRKYYWYSFLSGAESTPGPIMRPEGLYEWKITMTTSGVEPATFRFVAQCLDQLHHRVFLYVHLASNLNSPSYLRLNLPKSLKLHLCSFSSTPIYIKVVNVCYMNAVSWFSFSACIWTRVPCKVLARWTRFFVCFLHEYNFNWLWTSVERERERELFKRAILQ